MKFFDNELNIIFFGISVKKNPGSHPLGNVSDRRVKLLQNRSRKDEIVASIGRDLTYFEYDMITYPRLCSTCLTGVQVKNITKYHSFYDLHYTFIILPM